MSPRFLLPLILLGATPQVYCGGDLRYNKEAVEKSRAAAAAAAASASAAATTAAADAATAQDPPPCAPQELTVDCLALSRCHSDCEQANERYRRACYTYVQPQEAPFAPSCIDAAPKIFGLCLEDCAFDRIACENTPGAPTACRLDSSLIKEHLEQVNWCEFTVNALCERTVKCHDNLTMDQCIEDLYESVGLTCEEVDDLQDKPSLKECPQQLTRSLCSDDWHTSAPACFDHFTWTVGDRVFVL